VPASICSLAADSLAVHGPAFCCSCVQCYCPPAAPHAEKRKLNSYESIDYFAPNSAVYRRWRARQVRRTLRHACRPLSRQLVQVHLSALHAMRVCARFAVGRAVLCCCSLPPPHIACLHTHMRACSLTAAPGTGG
jgi:hypothetical protein